MSTHPGSEVEVREPIILQDPAPPSSVEVNNPLLDSALVEIVSLVSLTASAGVLWFARSLREKMAILSKRVEGKEMLDILPEHEIGRVKDILAQLSILTDADRVTLGVFHNGVIGAKGAHYDKVVILEGYNAPGVLPLPELHKDVKAENLMEDLNPLWNKEDQSLLLSKGDAPASCSLYMSRRDIAHLYNKLLTTGNIEIGVISFHWCSSYMAGEVPFPPPDSRGHRKFQELTGELLSIIQANKDRKHILG